MAQHIFTGSGAPGFTPSAVGQHYIDTTNNESYISVDTSSSSDWVSTTGGGGSWGSITGTLSDQEDLNQQLIDNLDGDGSYYLKSSASDFGGGIYEMTKDIPAGGGFGIPNAGVVDGDYLADFASVSGYPNVTQIPSGTLSFHINAQQTGGTKTAQIYAEFYIKPLVGVETLLGTSGYSQILTGSSVQVSAYIPVGVVKGFSATDRLFVRFKAHITGAGTDPDISLSIQGTTNSRAKFPYEIDKTSIGLANVDNTSDLAKPISTATQSAIDLKQDIISVGSNKVLGTDGSSNVEAIPGWAVESNYGGMTISLDQEPNGGSGNAGINTLQVNVKPLQASPNESVTVLSNYINLDADDSDFSFGTSGNAATIINNSVDHTSGQGDIGAVVFFNNYFNVGNGTDATTCKGASYSFGFGNINNAVTLDGPLQGYGFQPTVNSGATITSNAYVSAFYDYANMTGVSWEGSYTSFASGPIIGSMPTGNGFQSFLCNAQITTFNGTSGFTGMNILPTLGTFGTGSFTGINITPSITSIVNATGLFIDMSSVTGSNVKAIDVTGDVNISGDLTFTGALSIGQLNAFYGTNPVDGGGNPQTIHSLTSAMTALDSVTVANCDSIGVNTAMLITLEDNSVSTSSAFQLGFTALALPCVVETHTGSSLDYMSGTTTAINLSGSSTGGTIDTLRINRSVPIPNGITTINNSMGFFYHEPFGGVATNSWGIYIADAQQNYLESPLKIGGSDTITNSSIGLEVTDKAIRLATMDTTARNALTAVAGMMIFNTTTSALEYYDGSSWV